MLEELHPAREATVRALDGKEKSVLAVLLGASRRPDLNGLQVMDAADPGTICLRFCNGSGVSGRFGREIGSATYKDTDGVLVSISLSVDDEGRLFELDFWKVNFEQIERYPEAAELQDVATAG